MPLLCGIYDTDKTFSLIQYLLVFTLEFDDDSARVENGGRKLNKCPEIESSGNRYGVGEIKRTRMKGRL